MLNSWFDHLIEFAVFSSINKKHSWKSETLHLILSKTWPNGRTAAVLPCRGRAMNAAVGRSAISLL